MTKMNNHNSSFERTDKGSEQLLKCPDTYLLILHDSKQSY